MNLPPFNLAAAGRITAVVLLTVVCFWPVLQGTFSHIDDDAYVYRNDQVRQGLSLSNSVWALQSIEVSNWHPLNWMSLMLDVELFGISGPQMHGMNLFVHLLNCLLLFALIRRLLSLDAAFIATLVFAIHPLHVESVAWISQRKELLSFFFMLISIHAYLNYKQHHKRHVYYQALLAFLCALMSKPMAVSFPLLLILFDFWPLQCWPDLKDKAQTKKYLMEKLPFVVLAAIGCALALLAHSFAINEAADYSLGDRLILVVMAYVEYLRQFLFPVGLNFYYPVPELDLSLTFWICLILLSSLSIASLMLARRYPILFFAWWWYIITLLPVIGIIKVGGQFVADRYTYLPLTGLIIAIAYLIHQVAKEERFAVLAGSIIVLFFCGLITYDYAESWQHDISIARRAIVENPNNPIAYYVLVKGIETRLTQQVLDRVGESECVAHSVDAFAGLTPAEMACLQQVNADNPASPDNAERTKQALILASQHFREYELDQAEESLSLDRDQIAPQYVPDLIYFNTIHAVLAGDAERLTQSIGELQNLPAEESRSAALFLAYYQLGNIEAANGFLPDVLSAFAADS